MEKGDDVRVETRAGAEDKGGKGEGKVGGRSRGRRTDIEVEMKASEERMREKMSGRKDEMKVGQQ